MRQHEAIYACVLCSHPRLYNSDKTHMSRHSLLLFFAKCFRDGFLPITKLIITLRTSKFRRRDVECHDLTFLRATRDATSHVADVSAPLSENVNKMLLERTFKCLSVSNDTQNGSTTILITTK